MWINFPPWKSASIEGDNDDRLLPIRSGGAGSQLNGLCPQGSPALDLHPTIAQVSESATRGQQPLSLCISLPTTKIIGREVAIGFDSIESAVSGEIVADT